MGGFPLTPLTNTYAYTCRREEICIPGREVPFTPPSLPSLFHPSTSVSFLLETSLVSGRRPMHMHVAVGRYAFGAPSFWTATYAYTYRRPWKICIRQTDGIGQVLHPPPSHRVQRTSYLFLGGANGCVCSMHIDMPTRVHSYFCAEKPPLSKTGLPGI